LISSTGEHVKKILKQVSLRNDYTVYEEGGAYIVAGENQRGQRYECRVVPEAVDYLCDRTPAARCWMSIATGTRVPLNTSAPLTTSGSRETTSAQDP
jgi:hypothetical protein